MSWSLAATQAAAASSSVGETGQLVSFLQMGMKPGSVCRDSDGNVATSCFVVAYILYLLLNGLVTLHQGAPAPFQCTRLNAAPVSMHPSAQSRP